MLLLENSFQSTLSVRRATIEGVESRETHDISIHALRKESDTYKDFMSREVKAFQSTLSVRRATIILVLVAWFIDISIHALRKESDMARAPKVGCSLYFNPRSP